MTDDHKIAFFFFSSSSSSSFSAHMGNPISECVMHYDLTLT